MKLEKQRAGAPPHEWTADEDAEHDRLMHDKVPAREIAEHLKKKFGGHFSKQSIEGRLKRRRKAAVPRPPRGPAGDPHYIPPGHELSGVSRLKDSNGDMSQQWDKTRVAGAAEPPVPLPPSFLLKRSSVFRRGDGTTAGQWATYEPGEVERWEAIQSAIVEHVAEYVPPVAPVEAPTSANDDLLTVYTYGDPHMGMLAWAEEVGRNHDLKIAERELCECSRQMVARSPASGRALVLNVGDFWHAENDQQRTPKSGNKLDVDGRAGKVARVGLRAFQTVVDTARTKHPLVDVFSIPGNHDPSSSLWLTLYLQAVYANEPRVTVHDGFNPYQYFAFGNVLIGMCHGDGCKVEDLGEIMATDVPEMWGASIFRDWHTGHRHHYETKELRGCVVYTHRTLAPRDAWHHFAGYRAGQALRAFTYDRKYGLDSVAVVGVERVRAALESTA